MNEPKKRGRPSKADIAAREAAQGHVVNGDTSREPEDVIEQVYERSQQLQAQVAEQFSAPVRDDALDRAQAYALRVWSGQSESLGRAERINRVRLALEGQGLSMSGVKLPGGDEDDDWTAEDAAPVVWRKGGL